MLYKSIIIIKGHNHNRKQKGVWGGGGGGYPGEMNKREVVLDPQVSAEEIKSRKVELGLRVRLLLLHLF